MTVLDDRTTTTPLDTVVPTRARVIEQFQLESGCDESTAGAVLDFLVRVGESPDGFHHLEDDEIEKLHPVLDCIMPDDTAADTGSGSAHDLANRHAIPAGVLGSQFLHTRSRIGPQTFCTVLLRRF